MKGTHLGEFEELVLLTIASLAHSAYSVAICDELSKHADRAVRLGVVHAALNRLEEKGLVNSRLGEASATRGGKRKRFYTLTTAGTASLVRAKEIRDALWQKIPNLTLNRI
jgi:PadR family transcriptional regulator, regulatory protein PadR